MQQQTKPTQHTPRLLLPQTNPGYCSFEDERLAGASTFSDRGAGVSFKGEEQLLGPEPEFQAYITAASILKARAAVARGFVR
jgi:hypothetical protein